MIQRLIAAIVVAALGVGLVFFVALELGGEPNALGALPAKTDAPVIVSGSPGVGASTSPTTSPAPAPPIALGVYIRGVPSEPAKLDAYAKMVGQMPRVVMWFQSWAGPWNAFDVRGANAIRARHAMPVVSWEPSAGKKDDPDWALRKIVDGSHDAYIRSWTRAVGKWGHPIYVRLMYEMNGLWTPWAAPVNGNSPEEFVQAWRHIVDIARAEGAKNIRWIWSPNIDSGNRSYASYASVYPGDDYVDWSGLSGFNWGASRPETHWTDIAQIFRYSITKVREVTAKPLMITETGSVEAGGSKASWLTDGFANVAASLPQVSAIVWYQADDPTHLVDWRVDTSPESLAAFRRVLATGVFAGTLK